MLKENGHAVQSSRAGLGFVQPNPLRIAINRASTNHIVEDDFSSNEGDDNEQKKKRVSIFDRLSPHKNYGPKRSNTWRLGMSKSRIVKPYRVPGIQSLFPSRMKRRSNLILSCGNVFKVKMETIIITRTQDNMEDDRESVASSYHITLHEENVIEEEDAEIAPPQLEEGVKTTIDELKEINLGNEEDQRPIYVCASLTLSEEKSYVDLLYEFKDVFAWSYKEMPGLDPKVAVHHLSVKKGSRPIKQAQRRSSTSFEKSV